MGVGSSLTLAFDFDGGEIRIRLLERQWRLRPSCAITTNVIHVQFAAVAHASLAILEQACLADLMLTHVEAWRLEALSLESLSLESHLLERRGIAVVEKRNGSVPALFVRNDLSRHPLATSQWPTPSHPCIRAHMP